MPKIWKYNSTWHCQIELLVQMPTMAQRQSSSLELQTFKVVISDGAR